MRARSHPLIGVTACRKLIDPHFFHVVGEKYVTAVVHGAAGLPLLIPALGSELAMEEVLDRVDGLFLTGSPSNVEPHRYRGQQSKPETLHDPDRDATTLPLIPAALQAGIPILAVCRGFQEMNVALGGTLHQEVHNVPGYDSHKEEPGDPLELQYGPAHEVHFTEGGLLARLTGVGGVMVNSLHHQGVETLAEGVEVEATAQDGLVEAFRVKDSQAFALAIQWHPEWRVRDNPVSLAIFKAFGDASRVRARGR